MPLLALGNLLAILAAPLEIWLPRTSGGHTRQFLPRHEGGTVKPTGSAVFDTFAVISKDQPLHFHWPGVELSPEQFSDLEKILRRLTYFGRAESWCEATVTAGPPPGLEEGMTHWRCISTGQGEEPSGKEHADYALERRLSAALPLSESLRTEVAELLPKCCFRIWEEKPNRKTGDMSGKWRKAKPAELEAFASSLRTEPPSVGLLRCLLRASGEDMKDGLERPIGTRWVHYAVPRAIYQLPLAPRTPARAKLAGPPVTLVRFALNTATVNRPVLPPLTDTLLFADKFRAATLAWHGHLKSGEHPRNLCGRENDDNGERRVEGHNHAFFWPTDEDDDGFIDHVSVFCPQGLLISEVDALRRLLRIRQRGDRPDLLVTPVFIGDAVDFGPWKRDASVFVSATPYYCPVNLSHGKKSGGRIRSVEAEIRRSLMLTGVIRTETETVEIRELVFADVSDGIPATWTHVEFADPRYCGFWLKPPDEPPVPGAIAGFYVDSGNRLLRALEFCRRRRRHGIEAMGRMLHIRFAAPRAARPFSIGSQCHFGLGLFVPAAPARMNDER